MKLTNIKTVLKKDQWGAFQRDWTLMRIKMYKIETSELTFLITRAKALISSRRRYNRLNKSKRQSKAINKTAKWRKIQFVRFLSWTRKLMIDFSRYWRHIADVSD
jgi:hypothetical protein